ncbi:MAG: FHA domain-containing protein [Blastocatellia bacterium]|nr:FHA domain-containing protein [Blastocatellia bacterium]
MPKDTRQIIVDLEDFLSEAVRANYWLTPKDVMPTGIVSQILDELSRKRFIWVGNQTYVPNRLVVRVPNPTPEKLEECEVLFNSIVFTKYLYDYITETGYKLFDPISVEVRGYASTSPVTTCSIEFEWPTPEESADEITVKVDETEGRILEVYGRKPQIPRLARLTIMSGQVYRNPSIITRQTTFLGRLRNVLDKSTGEILRRNDFVFSRIDDESSPNGSVSRQHGTIVFENGDFFLYDSGSANGTSIERAGEAIEVPHNSLSGVRLADGDIIRLGTALVRFELDPDLTDSNVDAPTGEHSLVPHEEQPSASLTTVRVSRQEIEEEMRKILDSE